MGFNEELTSLINSNSKENLCGTPDFILAEFMSDCLTALSAAVNRREAWYGREQDQFGCPTSIFEQVNTEGETVAKFPEDDFSLTTEELRAELARLREVNAMAEKPDLREQFQLAVKFGPFATRAEAGQISELLKNEHRIYEARYGVQYELSPLFICAEVRGGPK